MSFIVTNDWLKRIINEKQEQIVVIDVRFQLTDPEAGRKQYESGHIPGAFYLDLNKDLSAPIKSHGGSHPLPSPDAFAEKAGAIGIEHDTTVVIYDQNNDMFAPRAWWLFHYFGHENTYVLDGGWENWVKNGNQISTTVPNSNKKKFVPKPKLDEVVGIDGVKQRFGRLDSVLIDSRDYQRYLGNVEPLYKKAGHIPGAQNYFWKELFTQEGRWKDDVQLKEHFYSLKDKKEIIVSCGSGVSACPNILALKEAGFKNVKLYPGSYSDWISYEENEVATGEE